MRKQFINWTLGDGGARIELFAIEVVIVLAVALAIAQAVMWGGCS